MKVLSGFWLKIIAAITMLIDHIGVVFFPEHMIYRIIGRTAFPIFAFLLVEGFFHTSDIKKYILRMGILAIISEIPFDLIATGNTVNFTHQNIFFTFVIGLLMMYMITRSQKSIYSTLWLGLAFILATVFMTDYSYYGIAVIYLFFYFRKSRIFSSISMTLASVIFGKVQAFAVLSVPFLFMYNGKKGPDFSSKPACKYIFYWFYPIHMIALIGIKALMS